MSSKVKKRARLVNMANLADLEENRELRGILEVVIAEISDLPCDLGLAKLSDKQFLECVTDAKDRLRRKAYKRYSWV